MLRIYGSAKSRTLRVLLAAWNILRPPRAELLCLAGTEPLRSRYVLSYYPSADSGDGAWHDVDVRTTRRGIDLRTAAGYYDY